MTLHQEALRCAHEKGYVVDENGEVFGPRGKRRLRVSTAGYLYFTVKYGGDSRPVRVHKLAAFQRYGERALDDLIQVRHIDGDKRNNRPGNLLLGSQSDNMMDKAPEDRLRAASVAARSNRALSDTRVDSLRRDRRRGMRYADLMIKYGVSKSTVSYIVNGITYGEPYGAERRKARRRVRK
jgi:hypothetical protein